MVSRHKVCVHGDIEGGRCTIMQLQCSWLGAVEILQM